MAIVHMNGFGTVPVSGDYIGLINASGGTSTWSRQAGRGTGGYSLRHTNSTTGTGSGTLIGKITFPPALINTQCSIGFALNHRANHTAAAASVFGLVYGPAEIWFGTGTSNIYVAGSGTSAWSILDSTPPGIGWHWWNFVHKSSGTVGFTRLYRDGTLIAEQQPDNVWAGGASTAVTFFFGNSNGSAQVDIADLIIRDDNTLIPDMRVDTLFPDGTSANGWLGSDGDSVNNHLLVNENPDHTPATYVGSATVNALDTYTLANLPSTASSVLAVQVGARATKSDGGAKTMQVLANSTAGTAADPGGGSTITGIFTTDGGTAWTTSSVNSMTAGIKVVS